MSKADAAELQDQSAGASEKSDRPVVVRKSRRGLKLVLAIVAAVALFAGGVFAAGLLNDDEANFVDEAAQSLALQQLVQLSEAADEVVQEAGQVEDVAALQQSGIQLQSIAVAVHDLGSQMQDPELRETVEDLGDGYLKISVGLVINNGAWTVDGADQLNEARDELLQLLDAEVPAPADE